LSNKSLKNLTVAVMLCCLLPAVGQGSNDGDGVIMTYGAGTYSCASWVKDRGHTPTYIVNMQWILGYVSSAGNCVELEKTDSNAMAAFMDKYCSEHPRSKMSDAAYELVETLIER